MHKKSSESLDISKKNSEKSLNKKDNEAPLTPADKINLIGKNDAVSQSHDDVSNSGGTQSPLQVHEAQAAEPIMKT